MHFDRNIFTSNTCTSVNKIKSSSNIITVAKIKKVNLQKSIVKCTKNLPMVNGSKSTEMHKFKKQNHMLPNLSKNHFKQDHAKHDSYLHRLNI